MDGNKILVGGRLGVREVRYFEIQRSLCGHYVSRWVGVGKRTKLAYPDVLFYLDAAHFEYRVQVCSFNALSNIIHSKQDSDNGRPKIKNPVVSRRNTSN